MNATIVSVLIVGLQEPVLNFFFLKISNQVDYNTGKKEKKTKQSLQPETYKPEQEGNKFKKQRKIKRKSRRLHSLI